jgi:hypothetical protein
LAPKRPFSEQATDLVTSIYDRIMGCKEEKLTGELVFRVFFSQGGIGQVQVERKENISLPGKG